MVYSLGDIIAQGYEGRDVADWDRSRIVRSGICGLIAHGPLSHLYYVGLDHVFAQQTLVSPAANWIRPRLMLRTFSAQNRGCLLTLLCPGP